MKIAEALVRIKDIKGKLNSLMTEISGELYYEQIDVNEPIPNVDPTINDFCSLSQELANYKNRINQTNAHNGLSAKIYRMEALRSMIKQLENLTRAKQVTVRLQRIDYEGPATKMSTFATYNVEALSKRVEAARAEIREIDLELQRLNWEIDLEE